MFYALYDKSIDVLAHPKDRVKKDHQNFIGFYTAREYEKMIIDAHAEVLRQTLTRLDYLENEAEE